MKESLLENIRYTAFLGIIYPEAKRFDYLDFFHKGENSLNYRLCKIKFFLGEKNGKEIILGLQSFYQNRINSEVKAYEEIRDKKVEVLDTRVLEIPPNDYICNYFLKAEHDVGVTQIKLVTKQKRIILVGNEEGEEKIIDYLNDNNNHIVLGFLGCYRKSLEAFGASYIRVEDYYQLTIGYFELKRKIRDKKFKKNIIEFKYNDLSEKDKVLFKVCCLKDDLFHSIIKYIFF